MARKTRRAYEIRGIDMYSDAYENMTKEQLAALAAHEAKMANQRMRRLEAAGMGGTSPTSAAYRVMKSDISRWFPEKAKFSEATGVYQQMRVTTIKAILRDLEYHKSLKTATVSGTRKTMKYRREQFQKKTGIKFKTQDQFDRFFKQGIGQFLFSVTASDEIVRMINKSKRSIDEIMEAAKAFMETDDGDKDNADKIARLMGYENIADARAKIKPAKKGGKGGKGKS